MWNAHHRQILRSGPVGREDYEAAAELIDRHYANGNVQRSKGREDYGKVVNLVWLGATLEGRELSRRLDSTPEETTGQSVAFVEKTLAESEREWSKSLPIQVAVGAFIAVLGAVVVYLIKNHAGIPL